MTPVGVKLKEGEEKKMLVVFLVASKVRQVSMNVSRSLKLQD